MELLADPNVWVAFLTLTALEVVLGIDNIIFITILVGRLPPEHRARARNLGLGLAMASRILLLFAIAWVMGLSAELFTVFGHGFSGRDLILLGGGLFLIGKATTEIHGNLEGEERHEGPVPAAASFAGVITQIAIIDVVFSLDSVITAVGMVDHVPVMVAAIVTAVLVMMVAAAPIGEFVERHPTLKILALSFLILVGTALVGDGLDFYIPKGYIYFAMAFSLGVEMLNMRMRARHRQEPLRLRHQPAAGAVQER